MDPHCVGCADFVAARILFWLAPQHGPKVLAPLAPQHVGEAAEEEAPTATAINALYL